MADHITDDEADLFRRAQAGDVAARDELMDRHKGLVYHLLPKTLRDSGWQDLEQEALCALWRAIELFDVDRQIRFSTYASRAILRVIQAARRRPTRRGGRVSLDTLPALIDPADGTAQRVPTYRGEGQCFG